MLLLAHTGITVGTAWVADKSIAWARSSAITARAISPKANVRVDAPGEGRSRLSFDYRLLLLGSLLPDIIDKPLGLWLLREALGNGRVFGHTLLFALLLVAVGVYLHIARRRLGVLCLALGTLAHLILDQMWLTPQTLLWPVYGLSFERVVVAHWLSRLITSLMTQPSVYVSEITGALLLAAFFWNVIRHGKLASFVRSGRVG